MAVLLSRSFGLVGAALFGALMWPVACASDPGIEGIDPGVGGSQADASTDSGGMGGNGATGGGGSGGSGWPSTGFGSACQSDADCGTGQCSDIGNSTPNKVCTGPCNPGQACPSGGYCAFHEENGYICIPNNQNQCRVCVQDADCPNIGDRCLVSPYRDRFCGRDCSFDGTCGAGYDCTNPEEYGAAPSVGGENPSDPGGTDDPDAGIVEPNPPMVCVPQAGESCACNASRNGLTRVCTALSGGLTCEGTETCNGATGEWEGCNAGSPVPEICDGADNDCNGVADDGTDATLCKHLEGPNPPRNTRFLCNTGACELAPCDPGWAMYPPGLPQHLGCTCQVESTETNAGGVANDSCANAADVGAVSDGAGAPASLVIAGRLSSDTDVDWYTFNTIDAAETNTNSYHVEIRFAAPVSNNEFEFSVIRGDTCGDPVANHSGLTNYNWCVDGTGTVGGATIGQQSCGPTADRHCGPHTRRYFVRVSRKPGATGTCDEYRLLVTGKGDFTKCDFTQACSPQVAE